MKKLGLAQGLLVATLLVFLAYKISRPSKVALPSVSRLASELLDFRLSLQKKKASLRQKDWTR